MKKRREKRRPDSRVFRPSSSSSSTAPISPMDLSVFCPGKFVTSSSDFHGRRTDSGESSLFSSLLFSSSCKFHGPGANFSSWAVRSSFFRLCSTLLLGSIYVEHAPLIRLNASLKWMTRRGRLEQKRTEQKESPKNERGGEGKKGRRGWLRLDPAAFVSKKSSRSRKWLLRELLCG